GLVLACSAQPTTVPVASSPAPPAPPAPATPAPTPRVMTSAAPVAPPTPAPAPPLAPAKTSGVLRNAKLHDPIPGGWLGGWNGDTGLDIAAAPLPVYALASGTLEYAEWGHTMWTRPPDTAFSVRIALDEPIPFGQGGEHRITHVYYTHLSHVELP